jgi:hypothetical protein
MSQPKRWSAPGHVAACVALAIALADQPASAEIVLEPGIYRLNNHHVATASPFGDLSQEQVFGLARNGAVLAFSFDHPSAEVKFNLRQLSGEHYSLRVVGTAWGTWIRRNGSESIFSGPAKVDVSYDLVRDSESDDTVFMTGTATKRGSIWFKGGRRRFTDLDSRQFAFSIADEQVLSGAASLGRMAPWVWRAKGADVWTFSVNGSPVPGPGCAALLGAAAFFAGSRRRRRG